MGLRKIIKGENATHKMVVIAIALATLLFIVAYMTLDTLGVYDAPGHVLAVENARHFWPSWHGWSPELLGWSQGSSYPPAIHWIMAGLSLAVGVPLAIKLVVALAIAVLPYALWHYLRSIHLSSTRRLLGIVGLLAIFLVVPDYIGSSIKGLFNLGLITNFVALPLLFFFMAAAEHLAEATSSKRKKYIFIAGGLLGILVWSHLVIAMMAAVYGFAIALELLLRRKAKQILPLFAAGTVALVVSSPFIATLLFFSGEQFDSGEGIASTIGLSGATTLLSLACGAYLIKHRQWTAARLALLATFFGIICTADALLTKLLGTSFIFESLHVYRFQIFALFFLWLACISLPLPLRVPYKAYVTPVALLGILLAAIAVGNPYKFASASVAVAPSTSISGRFLESFSRAESYPAPYTFQAKLATANPQSSWAYGLFIESAPNSAFIKSLSLSLNPNKSMSDSGSSISETVLPKDKQADILSLFGIENIISLDTNEANSAGNWTRQGVKKYYHIQSLGKQQLVEIPRFALQAVESDWEHVVSEWWKQPGRLTTLPYDASKHSLPSTSTNPQAAVVVNTFERTNISFNVISDEPVPVLIKTTYSSRWKAYDSQGNKLTVWKAAPHLMLIVAKGEVSLKQD